MPRTTDWRSPDSIDALKDLDRAELAWEFLRRNPEYREDYRRTTQRIASGEISEEAAMAEFSRRWGLSFRGRSRSDGEGSDADLATRARAVDRCSCRCARWFFDGA